MSKLQGIVIPQIKFDSITLRTVVEVLRRKSFELDPDPNPATRGVNIVLQLQKSSALEDTFNEPVPGSPLADASARTAAKPETRITLTLERLPLLEALRYLASQAGARVVVKPDEVSIVPISSAIQTLTTTEYEVPPELLGRDADAGANPQPADMKAWLEAKGVVFSPGALAVYYPRTQRLIVRNTQENLDKVVSVISSALKPAVPNPETP